MIDKTRTVAAAKNGGRSALFNCHLDVVHPGSQSSRVEATLTQAGLNDEWLRPPRW